MAYSESPADKAYVKKVTDDNLPGNVASHLGPDARNAYVNGLRATQYAASKGYPNLEKHFNDFVAGTTHHIAAQGLDKENTSLYILQQIKAYARQNFPGQDWVKTKVHIPVAQEAPSSKVDTKTPTTQAEAPFPKAVHDALYEKAVLKAGGALAAATIGAIKQSAIEQSNLDKGNAALSKIVNTKGKGNKGSLTSQEVINIGASFGLLNSGTNSTLSNTVERLTSRANSELAKAEIGAYVAAALTHNTPLANVELQLSQADANRDGKLSVAEVDAAGAQHGLWGGATGKPAPSKTTKPKR